MIIDRNKYLKKIDKSLQYVPITVLIGARQVGKTTLLQSFNTQLRKFFIDGQHPDTINLFSDINNVIDLLKIKLSNEVSGLLIIDEFQMIPHISKSLKILVDNFPELKILCSGSSSLDIIQKVEESLAGRIRMIYIYSLSFDENILFEDKQLYDEYQNYPVNTSSAVVNNQIKVIQKKQMIFGGMPRVCLSTDTKEKIHLLDDIYKTYLMRDVKNYVRNQDSIGFNKMLQLLALQIGNLVNINELSRTSGLSYYKCEEYIYLLEQMYIIKMVPPYLTNKRKTIKKMKKVFFLDIGIRNIIVKNFNNPDLRNDAGALFENFIFLELLKNIDNYSTLEFYRTKDGAEIDFILNDMNRITAFEVKYKALRNPVYFKQLIDFSENENVAKSYVVNINLQRESHKIQYVTPFFIEKILLKNS